MGFRELMFLGFSIIGGVALFILGLGIMTDGLRGAAGDRIRWILFQATRNRCAGVGFGMLLGFLAHSTAATVMMVGFVNAGLMTLKNSIPLLMGASIGTTFAMQLISFQLSEYAFVAIAAGFLVQVALPWQTGRNLGRAVLGFGLLLLGLDFVSGAIEPHREQFAPWLTAIDGTTWRGTLLGILVAVIITAILQSSGATIGLLFALIGAGVFTSLEQVFPVVLGAHIGTAGTALFVSIGASLEARRAALANLLFQVFNVLFALAISPVLLGSIGALGGDLVRQTANLHTAVMVVAVAMLLPFLPLCVRFVYRLAPARAAVPETTFLNPAFLKTPERAIFATLEELGRVVAICRESFDLIVDYLAGRGPEREKKIRLNEGIVNEVKGAAKDYLATLTRGYLSRRQALMVQHLDRIMADLERVGDHIESMHEIRGRQKQREEGAFDDETVAHLISLMEEARNVLVALADALSPDTPDFEKAALKIIKARDHYDQQSLLAKRAVNERVANHQMHPLAGLFFSEYVSALDRIVKHCKMIAREQQQPFFRIKPRKLEKVQE